MNSEEVKACCANAYSSDLVALLLGDSYHPGGLVLTRRMASDLRLRQGDEVLDVATGRGTTALLLAKEHGARVTGVDLSAANVTLASGAADAAGLADRVRFRLGDAEQLPFEDASFDVVVCECAFCTFPDKTTAAAELARVLRPGGRLGLADVTAEPERLPMNLRSLAARVACIADARSLRSYVKILEAQGFRITGTERHDAAIQTMIDQIEARIGLLRLTAADTLERAGIDLTQAPTMLAAAAQAVTDDVLGYARLTADWSMRGR